MKLSWFSKVVTAVSFQYLYFYCYYLLFHFSFSSQYLTDAVKQ